MNRTFIAGLFIGSLTWAQPTPQSDVSKLANVKEELARAQSLLRDWPSLGHYHDLNRAVSAPGEGEKRVVFLGDSITENWGRLKAGFFPGKTYLNRGIGGQTTPQMLIRFRQDVIILNAKVVVILAGTNDIAGNTGPMTLEATEDNIMSIAQLAKANGISVVLASLLPVLDDMRPARERGKRPAEKVATLNLWIKDYAGRAGLVFLDYSSLMLDDKHAQRRDWTNDGLHPNEAGYALMAPAAQRAIDWVLAGNPR
jgi:lysophospholipase L1-like esterase